MPGQHILSDCHWSPKHHEVVAAQNPEVTAKVITGHITVKFLLSPGQSFPGSSLTSYLLRCYYGLYLNLQVSNCALHQISLEAPGISRGILVKLFILLRGLSSSLLHKLVEKKNPYPECFAFKTVVLTYILRWENTFRFTTKDDVTPKSTSTNQPMTPL